MPTRSNKGGAVRGKARAALVKSMKKVIRPKPLVREGASSISFSKEGLTTKKRSKSRTLKNLY